MDSSGTKPSGAVVRHHSKVRWQSVPGHQNGSLSKMLVRPENSGSRQIDFRLSSYLPNGSVKQHAHTTEEQLWYILEGEALLTLDGDTHVVGPGTVIYMPPGVEHALENTGLQNLVFVACTVPPLDV